MALGLDWNGAVAVITWDDAENRINLDRLDEWHALLDEVEAHAGPTAMVATGVGKFFSNGLDLGRFGQDPSEFNETLHALYRFVARLYVFPTYCVAALNGHTFAGGALVSCAFDYRVMREDRGYWCMNEVDIGLPLGERLAAILFARLPRATAVEAMLTGRRYGGPGALAAGIVEEVASEDRVLTRAVEVAEQMATKDRNVVWVHKRLAHGDLVGALGLTFDELR
ncbi:MAG: enoyl-CoA hydratase/isomerase family protein [Acidimicrobiales bacterium]